MITNPNPNPKNWAFFLTVACRIWLIAVIRLLMHQTYSSDAQHHLFVSAVLHFIW